MNPNKLFNQSRFGQYRDYLKSQGISDNSIRRKSSSLVSFEKFLIKKGVVNPEIAVEQREEPKSKASFLSFFKFNNTQSFDKPFVRFVAISTIILLFSSLIYGLYRQTLKQAKINLAYTTSSNLIRSNRFLSFQGRLTDTSGNPITSSTSIVFKLFDTAAIGTGTSLYTSSLGNSQTVIPDDNGIFSVTIGQTHGLEIPNSVFTEHPEVFLEITAGSEVMSPRQPIATVAYALNAETLQGLPPSASGLKDTVLVIDSQGNLNLGETSPSIKSVSGTLGIEGQAVLLSTSAGSGGNITINPDLRGQLNLNFSGSSPTGTGGFVHAVADANFNSGNLISGQALTSNKNYNFLDFQNYNVGTTQLVSRFTVLGNGSVNVGGTLTSTNISIGNTLITAGAANLNLLTGLTPTNGSVIYSTGTNLAKTGVGTSGQVLVSNGASAPTWTNLPADTIYTAGNGITLVDTQFKLGGTLTQNTQIGTSSFGFSFLGNGNKQSLYIASTGNVGIGNTSPNSLLQLTGSGSIFSIGSTTGDTYFEVSDTMITSHLPTNFTSSGDVSIAHNLNFTNSTASYIRASSPFYIQTESPYANLDINLTASNAGKIYLNSDSELTKNLTIGGTFVSVGSTNLVTNLNSDLLDGLHSSSFLQVGSTGSFLTSLTAGSGIDITGTGVGRTITNTGIINTTNNTLTRSGSAGSYTLGLNLASANTWTGLQTFTNGIGVSSTANFTNNLNVGGTAYFNSYVGIGTHSPTSQLHVVGNGNITGNLTIGGTFVSVGSTNLVTNLNSDLLDGYHASSFLGLGSTGSMPYVNNTTDSTLTRSGTGPYTLGLNLASANTWTASQTFNQNTYFPGSGIWNTSGNVGIGTTSPTSKLHVVGNGNITGNLTIGGTFVSVGSTNLVTNLNSDLLDGLHSSSFLQVGSTGSFLTTLTAGSGISITGTGVGRTITNTGILNATNGTLTRSGSAGSYTLGLNLASANTWTGLQTFTAGIGVTGNSTFTSNLTIGGTLSLTNTNVGVGNSALMIAANGTITKRALGTMAFDSGTYDNYNHWKLQVNGLGTTNVLSGNAVNFIGGTGVSLSQSGSNITINNTSIGTTYTAGVGLTLSSANIFSLDYDSTLDLAGNKIGLNLGSANIWTASQTFNQNTYFPGSGIWNTSGNVGIGTTSPTSKLHVVGNGNITGNLTIGGTFVSVGSTNLVTNLNSDLLDGYHLANIQQYVHSRAQNLVTNGSGLLGNNTNFNSFTFDGSEAYYSNGSFKSIGSATKSTDEFMPVNPESRYKLEMFAKTQLGAGRYYAFIDMYDVDNKQINATHHMYKSNTLTTLAQPLNNGDTKIYLTNAANWNNDGTADVNTHLRSIILWNYTNSFGYTYPELTYSRNWYGNAWDPGAIDYVNNTITLKVPWSGGSVPAGTKLSNGSSGGYYKYLAMVNTVVPTTWTYYSGILDGVDLTGTNASGKFSPGTAKVKIGWLLNYQGSGETIWLTNLSFGTDTYLPLSGGTLTGNLTIGGTFVSVGSTNLVTNLNSDLLDGLHSSSFLQVGSTGSFLTTLTAGSGISITGTGVGRTITNTGILNATNGTLTRSGSAGSYTLGLNLASTNTWAGSQTFNHNTYFPGSGIWNTSGSIGIGTTSPTDKLTISGGNFRINDTTSSLTGLMINPSGMSTGNTAVDFVNVGDARPFNFRVGGINSLFINTAGNVGIGTTNPTSKLQIQDFTTSPEIKVVGQLNSETVIPSIYLSEQTDTNEYGFKLKYISSSNYFSINSQAGTTETSRLSIARDTGNVGIGTTSPTSKLHVVGNGNITGNLTIGGTFVSVGSTNLVTNLNSDLLDGLHSSAFIQIGNTGSLPYVNNATNSTLTRSGTGPYTLGLNLGSANTWTASQTFNQNTYFPGSGIWNTSGNVGIGTTNPTEKLEVAGKIISSEITLGNVSGKLRIQNGGTEQINLLGTTNSWANLRAGNAYFDYNVGIGTTSPTSKLHVVGNGNITGNLTIGDAIVSVGSNNLVTNLNADLLDGFHASDFVGTGSTGGFLTDLNAGIGIAISGTGGSRTIKVDYGAGIGTAGNQIINAGILDTSDTTLIRSGSVGSYTLGLNLSNSNNWLSNQYFSGNVGIGTTNPTEKLEIVGNLKLINNNPIVTLIDESFGDTSFPPTGFTVGVGTSAFGRDTTEHFSSPGSARTSVINTTIPNGSSSWMQTSATVPSGNTGVFEFYWKVSSEDGYDFFAVCIDNTDCTGMEGYTKRISGETDWTKVVLPLTAGSHTIKWIYTKDSYTTSGADTGWVDNILIKYQNSSNQGVLLLPDGNVFQPSFSFSNSPSTGIFSLSPNTLSIGTSGNEKLRINNSNSISYVDTNNVLTANGTFADSTGWTVGENWAILNGVVTHGAGSTAALTGTSTATSINTVYKIVLSLDAADSGQGYTLSLGGNSIPYSIINGGVDKTYYIKPNDSTGILSITPIGSGNAVGSFDNITIQPVISYDSDLSIYDTKGGDALEFRNNGGLKNTFIGANNGKFNIDGYSNTAIGNNAFVYNIDGGENIAVGNMALYNNTTGGWNNAVGVKALYSNTTGTENNAFGTWALRDGTNSYANNAFGDFSLVKNNGGGNNAFGYSALYSNTSGWGNIAMGSSSLQRNVAGSSNVAVGDYALGGNDDGSNNIAIGSNAGGGLSIGNNNIFIGSYGDSGDYNDRLYIGKTYDEPIIFGDLSTNNVGLGTNSPTSKLHVVGDANITTNLTIGGTFISVGSTNMVANLNAQYLNGFTSSSFVGIGQTADFITTLTAGSGIDITGTGVGRTVTNTGILNATNSTLTRSGSAGSYTLGLNLGSTNTWTGLQTFNNAGAPFAVGSNALISNLNANYLNGLGSDSFLKVGYTGFDNYRSWTANVGTSSLSIGSSSVLTFAAGNGLTATMVGNTITFTNIGVGTTYKAGVGLTLSDNTFAVDFDSTLELTGNKIGLNLSNSNTWTSLQNFNSGINVTGNSVFSNNLTIGGTFVSVGSTNLVTNLNADLFDGYHASDFLGIGQTGEFIINLAAGSGIDITGTGVGRTITNTGIINATNNTLTKSGSAGSYTLGLNLASANAWSGLQSFNSMGAPFAVGSSTVVTDLNSDLVDGYHASDFLSIGQTGALPYDNYNHWKLQVNGLGTTNVLSGNAVNFIGGTGVSLSQSGSNITINNTSIGTTYAVTNGLSVITTNTFGLGGNLTQNTNLSLSSYNLSFLGIGNTQSLFLKSNGNVGIGTTNPTEKLEVKGNLKLSDNTLSADSVTFDSTSAIGLRVSNPNGYVSLTPLNTGWAHIYTDRNNFIFNKSIWGINGNFSSYNTANLSLQTNGTTRLTVLNANGNVGIGNTLPTQKLDVAGNIKLTGTIFTGVGVTGASDQVLASDGLGSLQWINSNSFTQWTSLGDNIYYNDGNVGIGTTNFPYALTVGVTSVGADLSGNLYAKKFLDIADNNYGLNASNSLSTTSSLSLYATGSIRFNYNNSGARLVDGYASTRIQNFSNGLLLGVANTTGAISGWDNNLFLNASGNVGIGTTNPTAKLEIAGTSSSISNSNGDITIDSTSNNISLSGNNLINLSKVFASSGDSANPSYSFTSDTNTGMYSSSLDVINFVNGGSNSLTINASGNVGLGTTSPNYRLHVRDTNSNGVAFFQNLQTGQTIPTIVIQTGSINTGTTGAEFVRFLNSNGTKIGRIRTGNDVNGVVYSTAGTNDFAEYVHGDEPTEPTDLISFHGNKFGKAREGEIIAGTHSNFATFVGNESIANELYAFPLALAGIVDVKVSTINGQIKAGDPLTTSQIPGVAAKAINSGNIVGRAIADYSNSNPNSIGQVKIIVEPTFYSFETETGSLGSPLSLSAYSDARLKENVSELSDGYMDRIMQLKPTTFNYNSLTGYDQEIQNRKYAGFIAQDLMEVFPEMVEETTVNGIKYLKTDLAALQIYMVKALQEQQSQVTKLNEVNFTPQGEIYVGYNISDSVLASLGYDGAKNEIESAQYRLVDSLENTIEHIENFSEITSAKINTGLLSAKNIITDNIVASNIFSLQSSTDNLKTNTISPLSDNRTIAVDGSLQVNENISADSVISNISTTDELKTNTISPLLDGQSIIINGSLEVNDNLIFHNFSSENATINNYLTANEATIENYLHVANNLEVSNTVYGNNIETTNLISENFNNLNSNIGYLTANEIGSSVVETEDLYSTSSHSIDSHIVNLYNTNSHTENAYVYNTLYAKDVVTNGSSITDVMASQINSLREELKQYVADSQLATSSALLADSQTWTMDSGTTSISLTGDVSLTDNLILAADLTVMGNAQLANAFVTGTFTAGQIALKDNFIETTNSALYIQPSSTGSIHLLGDTLVIADTGDVVVNGNLAVKGKLETESLFANLIEAAEASISGTLTANKIDTTEIKIATDSASTIIAESGFATLATTSAQLNSNATAGTATLPAGKTELVISNNKLTPDSMVYLTPVGSTDNQVIYVKDKAITATSSFTIALNNYLDHDVAINWWIIN